jgi:hypothetical protein
MNVPLREGDFDLMPLQGAVDLPEVVGHDRRGPLHGGRREPDNEFEIQTAVAEADEPDLGLVRGYVRERVGNGSSGLDPGFADQFLVRAVGHAEGDVDAAVFLVQGPVRQATVHEFRVRHEDVNIVVRGDAGAAEVYLPHPAHDARCEFHEIVHLEAPLEQDDQAGDEIIDDGLQAEADAHAESSGHDREVPEVETDRRQADQDPDEDDDIVQHPAESVERRRADADAIPRDAVQTPTNELRSQPGRRNDERNPHDIEERNGGLADLEEASRKKSPQIVQGFLDHDRIRSEQENCSEPFHPLSIATCAALREKQLIDKRPQQQESVRSFVR